MKGMVFNDKFQAAVKQAIPKHMDAGRFLRVVLSSFNRNPKLMDCTPESVLLSILTAAAYGLEPDGGPVGHGYLIPRWNGKAKRLECNFEPGYRGLVKLARNSGEVANVTAEVVRVGDFFEYEKGLEPKLKHKPDDSSTELKPVTHAYAVARFRDGEKEFIVMNRAELDRIKNMTSSKDKEGNIWGPWVDHESEMQKKTAVRRISKLLPLSVEIQNRINSDEDPSRITEILTPSLPALELDIPEDNPDTEPENQQQ